MDNNRSKATNTHSEYVKLIAFPLQQWLCEHTTMLCYTYIACLVNTSPHSSTLTVKAHSTPQHRYMPTRQQTVTSQETAIITIH